VTAATDVVRPAPRTALRLPAFWLTLVLTLGGFLLTAADIGFALVKFPVATAVAIALFALHGTVLFLIIRSLDYLEPEPPRLVLAALAWGGFVAAGLAGFPNGAVIDILTRFLSPTTVADWSAAIAAPPDEEILKGLGVVMIVLLARRQINSVTDGVVYGAFVGLGFEVLENISYATNAAWAGDPQEATSLVVGMFLLRGVINGLWGHAAFTAITGAGVAWAVLRRDRSGPLRVAVALLGLVGAMLGHFLWNSPLITSLFPDGPVAIIAWLIKGVVILVLFVVIARLAGRHEAGYYASHLREVDQAWIASEREIITLGGVRARYAARWHAFAGAGWRAQRAVRRLQRAQAALAVDLASVLVPTDLGSPVVPAPVDRREGVAGAHARAAEIAAVRQALNATGVHEAVSPPMPRRGTALGWSAIVLGVVALVVPVVGQLPMLLLFVWCVRRARRTGRPVDVRVGIGFLMALCGAALTIGGVAASLLGAG
jgi:RsiW-degrading membrane proteinase PrsW (M82 family)